MGIDIHFTSRVDISATQHIDVFDINLFVWFTLLIMLVPFMIVLNWPHLTKCSFKIEKCVFMFVFRALKPKLLPLRPQSSTISPPRLCQYCLLLYSLWTQAPKNNTVPSDSFHFICGPVRCPLGSSGSPSRPSFVPGWGDCNVSLSRTSRQKRLPLIAGRCDFVRSEFDGGGMTELCGCERDCVAEKCWARKQNNHRESQIHFKVVYWLCSFVFT